ncbi:MAG: hypothetical protein V1703_04845 [Candidatus Altiarchaeota archaeon]
MRKRILAFLVVLAVFTAGCCCNTFVEGKEKSEKVVDNFYSKVKAGDYEGTLSMYHSKWFELTPRNKTIDFLQKVDQKLGKVEGYSLVDWNMNAYAGTEGTGNYITLEYEVNRTNYSSEETFTIFNPQGTEEYLILGYNINSMGLI